jgi:hypothetical protein
MRILYVSNTLTPKSGAAYKVMAIAREWERRGHSLWLTTTRDTRLLRMPELVSRLSRPGKPRGLAERVRGELAFRVSYPIELARHAARLGIDVLYCREIPPAPGLRPLMRRFPFVLEVNGDVARETRSLERSLRLWSRPRQLRDAAGVVFVSRALQHACGPGPARSIVIANPCLPSAAPVAITRPPRPTLALAGYARHPWSGMDKLVALARAAPDLDFLAIGAELTGPSNLRSVPPVTQAEADRLLRGCTVGIGPLATHRKGMTEASPLKSRNYLALGVPVIQAYEDTDLRGSLDCILQLPNCEDNILPNVERIREFAWRAFRDPSLSRQALELAAGPLSLGAKEATRLAFIEGCLNRPRP